jgi:hypothetical protein
MVDGKLIIKTKLTSVKATLERTPEERKRDHVSIQMGEDFNTTRDAIAKEYPELATSLPPKLMSSMPYRRVQQMNVTYLDLEIFCEQLLSLLSIQE